MMKKIYFILLCVLISLIYNSKLLAQCSNCNYLYLNNPRTFGQVNSSIEEAVYVVKSVGLYTLYDVYLTYSSANPYYNSPLDSFEVVHYFSLPKEAAVVDSWLWVDDFIMKAQILDRNAAFNIYEGIVNRRKDPSILYKNSSTSYEFRIFPLPAGKTRKVKLSILMPSVINGEMVESSIPLSLIKPSLIPIQPKIISYDKDNTGALSLNTNNVFVKETNAEFGPYSTTKLTTDQVLKENVVLGIKTSKSQGHSIYAFKKDSVTNQGYFQMQIDPSYLFKDLNVSSRNVAIFIDHNSSNTSTTKEQIKYQVKQYISRLSSKDLIKIYYSKLNIKQIGTDWVRVGDINVDEYLKMVDLGNSSLLISGLNQVYADLKNEKNADLVIFSSDASITSVNGSQQLKNDLVAEHGQLNKTYVINYADPNIVGANIYYENRYYKANELFYKILTSNTKGLTINLQTYYENNTFDEAIGKIYNAMQGISYDYFQYYIRPKNGICFDIYSNKIGNKDVYFGRYKGEMPLTLEYTFLIKDSVVTNQVVLDDEVSGNKIDLVRQTHVAQKLRAMEEQNQYSNRQYITELSMENRVLSLYTAFLALDPNLQEPCFDCENEVTVGVIDENAGDVQVSSYPNPFVDKVAIKITNIDIDDIKDLALYDIAGRAIKIDFELNQNDKDAEINVDASQLDKGIYILRFHYKGKVYTMKIVKA